MYLNKIMTLLPIVKNCFFGLFSTFSRPYSDLSKNFFRPKMLFDQKMAHGRYVKIPLGHLWGLEGLLHSNPFSQVNMSVSPDILQLYPFESIYTYLFFASSISKFMQKKTEMR